MVTRNKKPPLHYDPSKLLDAPEHYALSQAMGVLTWSTSDPGVRPVGERIEDFVRTYPPADPTQHIRGETVRISRSGNEAVSADAVLSRFRRANGETGSLHELLARFGLKMSGGPSVSHLSFEAGPFREVAQRRNHKLRVLHGGVDIEAENMDAAKAAYVDSQEKQQAAAEVRAARKRIREEIAGETGKKPRDG